MIPEAERAVAGDTGGQDASTSTDDEVCLPKKIYASC